MKNTRTHGLRMILAVLLIAVLVGPAVFAAGSRESSPAPAAAAPGQAPARDVRAELTVWLVRDSYKVDLTDWARQYPNVTINYEVVPWERTLEQLLLTAGTSRAPDIAILDSPWLPVLAGLNHLLPLDSYIATIPQSDLADFSPAIRDFVKFRGVTYAMPLTTFGRALFYRADWFAAAGIPEPKTWDDVIAAGKRLQDPSRGIWGLSVRGKRDDGTTQGWLPIFASMGGRYINEIPQINTPEGIAALKLYQDLVWREKIMSPDTVSFGSGEARGLFLSGNAAMAIIGSHIAPAVVAAGTTFGDFRLTHIPVPRADMTPMNVNTSFQWGIMAATRHRDLAFEFVKYASSPAASVEVNKTYMEAVRLSTYQSPEYRAAKPWLEFFPVDQRNMMPLPKVTRYNELSDIIQRAIQEVLRSMDTDAAAIAADAQRALDALRD